jgi:hypothetical protein
MHRHSIRRTLSVLLLGVFGLAGSSQAAIDFESIAPNLFFSGDSFSESGFTLTQTGDFGVVDSAATFVVAVAPSGNSTQFYAGLNDSGLLLTSSTHSLFSLSGFDAAFVAPVFQDPGVVAGRIVVSAIGAMGETILRSWEFAPSGQDGSFAFLTYNAATDFLPFSNIQSAFFLACSYEGDACVNPADNLAQFALDNVNVAAVPEPSTYALVMLGLAAITYRRRRQAK